MTPQISTGEATDVYSYRQPNLTYRLGTTTVAGKIDKLDAVRQAVYHILMTERYSNQIYGDDYGVELEQYVGKDIGYITADIENTLREALCQDDRITDVQVNGVTRGEQGGCLIDFTVFTIYGNFDDTLSKVGE